MLKPILPGLLSGGFSSTSFIFNAAMGIDGGNRVWSASFLSARMRPKGSQRFNTALVTLFSGVFATGIFLHARNHAQTPNEQAGVGAAQSNELIFAPVGGVLFLGFETPDLISLTGLMLILTGLFFFLKYQT